MPYIDQDIRMDLELPVERLASLLRLGGHKAGSMNYVITRLLDSVYGGINYATYNEAIGVLECVKLEYYRRVIALYEDEKKEENGDVYDFVD